jgi:hypothetical protein
LRNAPDGQNYVHPVLVDPQRVIQTNEQRSTLKE